MRTVVGFLLLGAAFSSARAQAISQVIADGERAYQASQVEQARQLFSSVLNTKQQVTTEQKVKAYTYLGAYWALQSSAAARDSASSFFIAALDYDPFTTLDNQIFAADEQAAFALARTRIFRVGAEAMHAQALNPNATARDTLPKSYTFRIVTTHQGTVEPRIYLVADPARAEVFAAFNNDGVTTIQWNGLINGVRADTGIYNFVVLARDRANQVDSTTQRFRIEHVHAALEDTLPDFRDVAVGPSDTLKSRRSGAAPYTNGAKGLFIGIVAGALPFVALSASRSSMANWAPHAALGASIGLAAGLGAGVYANSHRDDAAAVAENARRRQVRAEFNAGVRARNQARLDATILVIRPLTVSGTGN